jgi:hypothetical protein
VVFVRQPDVAFPADQAVKVTSRIALPDVAFSAQHLAVLRNSVTAFGPWLDVIALHLLEIKMPAAYRTLPFLPRRLLLHRSTITAQIGFEQNSLL